MIRACVHPTALARRSPAPALAALLALTCTPAFAQQPGNHERPEPINASQPGSPSAPGVDEEETYRLDFQSIPLSELVLIVSAITGDNYVFVPDTLSSRRIMLVSPRPLSATDVGDLFVAALSMTGLHAEDRGSFWIIRED